MPFVKVRYIPNEEYYVCEPLRESLACLIAKALHVETKPEAHLSEKDVIIEFAPYGKYDVVHNYDFMINITANYYAERLINLNSDRVPLIRKEIECIYSAGPNFENKYPNFCIYVELVYAGFVECLMRHK